MTLALDGTDATRPYRPHPSLESSVRTYFRGCGDGATHQLLPDGCVDLLFDLCGVPVVASAHAVLVGPATRAVAASRIEGAALFGVTFEPGAAQQFLGVPLDTFRDRAVALRDVLGPEVDALVDRLREQPDDAARVIEIDTFLRARAALGASPSPLVQAAIGALRDRSGVVAIPALCRDLGTSERRLQRTFSRDVGVSVKTLARIVRVHAAIDRLVGMRVRSLTTLAYELGYTDQAHLNHEFQCLVGTSPGAFARSMSDFYKERIGIQR